MELDGAGAGFSENEMQMYLVLAARRAGQGEVTEPAGGPVPAPSELCARPRLGDAPLHPGTPCRGCREGFVCFK